MSAQIIDLAKWLMGHRGRQLRLPKADWVARQHIAWLRAQYPAIRPQTAAAMIGRHAWTWRQVIRLYAEAWEELPEAVRRAAKKE